MMTTSDIRELYQEVILEHNKTPQNYGVLEVCTHSAHGHNPLCGDELTVYLNVSDGVIGEVRFEGQGCAISKASASIMTTELKGKTVAQAKELFDLFTSAVTTDIAQPINSEDLGNLIVVTGVREFPVRVKCATLAWHTLKSALDVVPSVV
jgi:nitrogen fixation protein NifU and related proteins